MEEILFILLFLLLPIIWLILLKFANIRILTISIPSILLISIFVKQYLGYLTIFFYLDDYRSYYFIDRNVMWLMFFLTSLSITLMLIGFILAKLNIGSFDYNFQNDFVKNKLSTSYKFEHYLIFILFLISSYVLYLYLSRLGFENIALFKLLGFTETKESAYYLRSKMGNDFSGNHHWYRLFFKDFLLISSYTFFASFLIHKKKISIFIISFLITSFSLLVSTAKGPVIWYFIGLFILYIIVKKKSKLNNNIVYIFSIFLLILIGLQLNFIIDDKNLFDSIQIAISRITVGQMSGLYHYLTLFPEKINFLNGRSFPNPGGIFPFEHYNLTQEIEKIVSPDDMQQDIVGSIPTFYWGEMYANFGYIGVIIPPFFIGYLIYWLNIIFHRIEMSPLILSLYTWSILHYQTLSSSSLSDFIIDIDTFIIFFVVVFIVGLSNRGKIKLVSSNR